MLNTQKRNIINQQTKNKSSSTTDNNNNVEENTEKEATETTETTDIFANTLLEYDMVMNFELLSLTIPNSTEEAIKVRQSLVERKVHLNIASSHQFFQKYKIPTQNIRKF
jgi:hypothetical protein